MEQTPCSEMSAYKIQTPGNYPEENIQQRQTVFTVLSLVSHTGKTVIEVQCVLFKCLP